MKRRQNEGMKDGEERGGKRKEDGEEEKKEKWSGGMRSREITLLL